LAGEPLFQDVLAFTLWRREEIAFQPKTNPPKEIPKRIFNYLALFETPNRAT
jgi:hypothetical protein